MFVYCTYSIYSTELVQIWETSWFSYSWILWDREKQENIIQNHDRATDTESRHWYNQWIFYAKTNIDYTRSEIIIVKKLHLFNAVFHETEEKSPLFEMWLIPHRKTNTQTPLSLKDSKSNKLSSKNQRPLPDRWLQLWCTSQFQFPNSTQT